MRRKLKVTGVFGGSFDPVHEGHTNLADFIVKSGLCDKVLLMVSPLNPLKIGHPPVSFEDRMEMTRLATRGIEGVQPSDFEATLPLPSYTCLTLEALSELYPDTRFRLIIGADNWKIFHEWRNYEKIIREFTPIIYPRPGIEVNPSDLPTGVTYLEDAPETPVSSTELRKYLSDSSSVRPQYINPSVWDYARSHRLYISTPETES